MILLILQLFFFTHTIAGLALIPAALLAYLVLLFKIFDGQAGLALEAECGAWR